MHVVRVDVEVVQVVTEVNVEVVVEVFLIRVKVVNVIEAVVSKNRSWSFLGVSVEEE